jgi:hypothetical protein
MTGISEKHVQVIVGTSRKSRKIGEHRILMHFSLPMGDIVVDMSQGHRIRVRVFGLLYS